MSEVPQTNTEFMPSGLPSGGAEPGRLLFQEDRRPDILSVGGGVRLAELARLAGEFGATPEVMARMLDALGVPYLVMEDGRRLYQIPEVEIAIARRVVRGIQSDDDAHRYLEWANRYCGVARRRAILESLRTSKPLWDRLRQRVERDGYRSACGHPAGAAGSD